MVEHKKLSAVEWYESDRSRERESPIPLSVIPNYMGINPVGIDSIQWTRQIADRQLISVTINFKPHDFKSETTDE